MLFFTRNIKLKLETSIVYIDTHFQTNLEFTDKYFLLFLTSLFASIFSHFFLCYVTKMLPEIWNKNKCV